MTSQHPPSLPIIKSSLSLLLALLTLHSCHLRPQRVVVPNGSSLSTGGKVGIGVGVPVGVLLLAALVFFLFWRHRRDKRERAARRQEVEDYGFNPNDLSSGVVGGAANGYGGNSSSNQEMTESAGNANGGYRGWNPSSPNTGNGVAASNGTPTSGISSAALAGGITSTTLGQHNPRSPSVPLVPAGQSPVTRSYHRPAASEGDIRPPYVVSGSGGDADDDEDNSPPPIPPLAPSRASRSSFHSGISGLHSRSSSFTPLQTAPTVTSFNSTVNIDSTDRTSPPTMRSIPNRRANNSSSGIAANF
ncbi:hypothetical protein V1514DRAFT_331217 [Lipomyces japonicus]|uniref:uncharacterized protein n=1 Tax=Lipomyces japonicus TaxID=56871 RepID=UPI0034CFEAE2